MRPSHIKLPHSVIVKSPGLLPMHYTVAELAEAVGAVERTLRDWLMHGAPYLRGTNGHIWINGREFAGWVVSQRNPARKQRLREDQAYCMHCKSVVDLLAPETRHVRGKLTHTRGKCGRCGRIVHRGGRVASNPAPSLPEGKGPEHERSRCTDPSR